MTQEQTFDVVGIGNAIVDVVTRHPDELVERLGMDKGRMVLIDADQAQTLYAALGEGLEVSGGSVANSIAGVASLGGRAAFLGRVYDDELGRVFAHDLRASGVHFDAKPAVEGPPTGRCLIIVTPDAQRTMNTYLGAAAFFCPEDVDAALVSRSKVLLLEGYLFDKPESKRAYQVAADIAHEAGREVALTLSDLFCVERHRDDWLPLVRDRVDILFANETEACALWGCDDVASAVDHARRELTVGCITLGPAGSIVVAGDEVHEIDAHPVAPVVDTTGAGDLYAAGFLYGYTQSRPLPECGRLGSIAAAAVLGHTGARPEVSLAQLLDVLG